jgi:formiminotetrahydrofolate cyclodeaminase
MPSHAADVCDETLDVFLTRLASDAPAPGGGAAAALAAAMGAALVAMACRVTRRREPDAPALVDETAAAADRLRAAAVSLGAEDSAAYARVVEARRRPPAERAAALSDALKQATEVPLAVARVARDVLAAGARVAPRARPSALSDLGVAASLAWAALEAGAGTARSNLAQMDDAEYVGTALAALARLIDEAAPLRRRLAALIAER